jgi:hypothetical protein
MNSDSSEADIKGSVQADNWLVVGWFTPDYRALAENFAANLEVYRTPFHLFSKSKSEKGWNTWRKPSVVLQAMSVYPGKTIVLMDVDCILNGDIASLTSIGGDVGIRVNARRARLLWPMHKRVVLKATSQVAIFHPTEGAKRFASEWERQCAQTHYSGDEAAMLQAFLTVPGVAFTQIGSPAMVDHASAHACRKPRTLKERLKAIERRFRTGRTQAAKEAGLGR